MKLDLDNQYIHVPEEYLEQGVEIMEREGDFDSSFHKMVQICKEYREAELTPLVVYDLTNGNLLCVVKELYGKKLH